MTSKFWDGEDKTVRAQVQVESTASTCWQRKSVTSSEHKLSMLHSYMHDGLLYVGFVARKITVIAIISWVQLEVKTGVRCNVPQVFSTETMREIISKRFLGQN